MSKNSSKLPVREAILAGEQLKLGLDCLNTRWRVNLWVEDTKHLDVVLFFKPLFISL